MISFYPKSGVNKSSSSKAISDVSTNEDSKISILIPTWNNLPYLKLCIHSIKQNSKYAHQIIVHVNEGSDGTLEWVKDQGYDYTYSRENVGICWAMNASASLAQTDYIVYLNDDMYVLPEWDTVFLDHIEKLGHDMFFLSSTMIEPSDTGNPGVIVSAEFGDSVESFDEQGLLGQFSKYEKTDWSGGTFPPNIVAKRLWDLVGGYSIEFSPGMASDPDFAMKLWQCGVRHIVGLGKSRVFHFQCKSTGRVKMNDGRRQFMRKWRIAISTFKNWYLHYGDKFASDLPEASPPKSRLTKDYLRSRW